MRTGNGFGGGPRRGVAGTGAPGTDPRCPPSGGEGAAPRHQGAGRTGSCAARHAGPPLRAARTRLYGLRMNPRSALCGRNPELGGPRRSLWISAGKGTRFGSRPRSCSSSVDPGSPSARCRASRPRHRTRSADAVRHRGVVVVAGSASPGHVYPAPAGADRHGGEPAARLTPCSITSGGPAPTLSTRSRTCAEGRSKNDSSGYRPLRANSRDSASRIL